MAKSRITAQRVQQARENRFNPLRTLTPELLTQHLEQFRVGALRGAALVWDAMMEHDHYIGGSARKRFKGVSRRPWEVLTLDDSERAEQHAAALNYFYNNLRTRSALDAHDRGGFGKLVRQQMVASGMRYSVHEMVLKPRRNNGVALPLQSSKAGFKPDTLLTAEFVHCPLWWFECRTGQLAYLKNEFDYYGEPIRDGEWLVTVGDGLMIASSIAYMFKGLALKDWISFNGKFGTPFIDAATDAAPGSDEWDLLVEAVEGFGNDGGLVRSKSSAITLIEATKSGDIPFEKTVQYMDKANITLWRGGDLGTLSSDQGQGTGASLQEGESLLLEQDDCEIVTEALNDYVDRMVIGYLFDEEPLAYVKLLPRKMETADRDIKIAEFLLKHKARVGENQMRERLGMPEPDEDDTPLEVEEPKPVAIANSNAETLEAEALQRARTAIAMDLQPLMQRLEAVLGIEDAEIRKARLQALLAEWDRLKADVQADPELARVVNETMASAFVEGVNQG